MSSAPEKPVDFPLPSLRDFMLPDQLVSVKTFEASSVEKLDAAINDWINETKSIVAIPSTPGKVADAYLLTLTYIPASVGVENV